jgi:hypothetical protein
MIDQSTLAQVDQKAAQYMGNPEALQQMYQQKQQLIDLLALQKIKSEKEAAARDMTLKMAQQSGQPQTIAQQREQQVLDMTKQEMVQQQAGNLGHQQQEQQQNLQQVLKGMSQGAQQPPQQGTPGVPQQSAPGIAALPTQGLMPPKAMAGGGIVAFSGEEDSYVGLPDWEEEWKKRQEEKAGKGTGKEVPRSWWERNVVNPDENRYALARDIEARRIARTNKSGVFTPQTDAEREAEKAKDAIVANLKAGKYDPTGKPLVPMIGKEKQSDVFARMEAMKKDGQKGPVPETQAPVAAKNPLQKVLDKNKLTQQPPKDTPVLAPQATAEKAPAGGLQGIMEAAATKQVGRDPVAEARAKREEATAALGYNPEEKAKFEANQKAMADYDKAQFDPEKLRSEQLTDFLLGGAGHSTMGMTLSSSGKAGVSRRRQQEAMERARMGERQTKEEGLLELGRKAREKGFELGEKTAEGADAGVRQGLASGASMVNTDKEGVFRSLDRASREKIAALDAQVRREVNQADKEGVLALKQQTLLASIDKAEETAVSTATKSAPAYAIIKNIGAIESMGGKLDKDQVAKKQSAEADLDKITLEIRNKFQDTRAMVMSGNSNAGLGSLSTGGWKVTPVTPAKK